MIALVKFIFLFTFIKICYFDLSYLWALSPSLFVFLSLLFVLFLYISLLVYSCFGLPGLLFSLCFMTCIQFKGLLLNKSSIIPSLRQWTKNSNFSQQIKTKHWLSELNMLLYRVFNYSFISKLIRKLYSFTAAYVVPLLTTIVDVCDLSW